MVLVVLLFFVFSNLWYLDDCHYTKGVDGMSMNVDKSGLLMYMPIK